MPTLRSRLRFGTRSVCLGLVLLALQPAQTQTAPQDSPLPKTIHLRARAKTGDQWQANSSTNLNINVSWDADLGTQEHKIIDDQAQQHTSRSVLDVDRDGNIRIEEQLVSGKNVLVNDDVRKVVPLPHSVELHVISPLAKLLQSWKVVTPKPAKGSKKPGKPELRKQPVISMELQFPEQSLSVGDTWEGAFAFLPLALSDQPEISYTATLAAIEMHRDIPCARVEYTLKTDVAQLPQALRSLLPPTRSMQGKLSVTGTLTAYYALDRGYIVDEKDDVEISLHFVGTYVDETSGNAAHYVIDGAASIRNRDTATKFPAYDASLLTAVSTSAP